MQPDPFVGHSLAVDHDEVDAQALHDFIDAQLARDEARPPDDDTAVREVLRDAYVRPADGWCAVQVLDDGREVELAAPSIDQLYDSVKRFLLR